MNDRVTPLMLGPKNCEAAMGLPWRHVRDHARLLGVQPVRIGRKLAVPADAFIKAVESIKTIHQEEAGLKPAEQVRRMLGKRRRLAP